MAMNSHQHTETTEHVVNLSGFIIEVREDENPREVAKKHLESDIFNAQIDSVVKLK